MLNRRSLLTLMAAAPLATLATPALARAPRVFQSSGIAINGIDPVAYFTDKKPVEGSSNFTAEYEGATFLFTNQANLDAFKANTQKYAPVFGGYCAYAASLGYRAPTDPAAWTVHQGKLYLNASLRARELWSKDIPGNIKKGLSNWPAILDA